MLEDYLGAKNVVPLGTLYNMGDGIRIAQEVGADLQHMNNFELLGLLHGMAFAVPACERARLLIETTAQDTLTKLRKIVTVTLKIMSNGKYR